MNTIVHGGKDLLRSTYKSLQTMIDKYCPDGQQCQDIATLGGLAFCFFFMYIAMKPIFVF